MTEGTGSDEADDIVGFSAKDGKVLRYRQEREARFAALRQAILDHVSDFPEHALLLGGVVCEAVDKLFPDDFADDAPRWTDQDARDEKVVDYLLRVHGEVVDGVKIVRHTSAQLRSHDGAAYHAYKNWMSRQGPGARDPLGLLPEVDVVDEALRLLDLRLLNHMSNLHMAAKRRGLRPEKPARRPKAAASR